MSIAAFQQALCDLIASPRLCRELRAAPDGVLAHYELTERERTRLMQAVRQPGMSTNCTLYRSNRVTPIERVRAAASILAIGTGCDQRVGSAGFEM